MTNNSLIAGMDDVVAHIQKLEKENKALKEQLLQVVGVNCNTTGEGIILKPPTREDYIYRIEKLKEEHEEKMEELVGEVMRYEQQLEGEEELNKEIKALKEEKEGYFQAWLYYWSGGEQGKEHMIPMSEIKDGKYQKILDGGEQEEEEEEECEITMLYEESQQKIKELQSKVAELEKFKKEAEDTTESFPVMESMMDQLEEKDKQIEEKDKQIAIFTKDKESNIWGHGTMSGNVFVKFNFKIVDQWISSFIDCYSDGNYCDSDELNLEDEVQEALFEDVAKELNDVFNACLFDRFGNIESTSRSGEGELQQACWDRLENMIIKKYLDKMEVDTEVKREGIDKTVRISLYKYREIFINGEEDTDNILGRRPVDMEQVRSELGDRHPVDMTVEDLKQLLADAGDPEYSQ